MYDTILVPTDGSDVSERAAAHAADLAAATGAALYAVSVVDETAPRSEVTTKPGAPIVEQALEDAAEQALANVAAIADERGVDLEPRVRRGTPHRQIRRTADQLDADLIVMGTHGRSGLDRYLLGSVAERTLRTADRPVLVVTADEADGEAAGTARGE